MSACSHCRLSYKLMLERYDEYCGCTRRGEHGKPAMFWMTYIDLVKIYLLLDRACRTNDVDLYIYTLLDRCSLCSLQHIAPTMPDG